MERQRLPVEQFGLGPPASTERMTLTNGSLRPKALARTGVFFSGAVDAVAAGLAELAGGGVLATAGAGALALGAADTGAFLPGLVVVLVADFAATGAEPVFFTGAKVPVITEGLLPAFALLPVAAPEELLAAVWPLLAGPVVDFALVAGPVLVAAPV
jgi:hypothetical protein